LNQRDLNGSFANGSEDRFSSMKTLYSDYNFLFNRKPKLRNLLSAFLFFPGFRAVAIMRLQLLLQSKQRYRFAMIVSNFNHSITGMEVCVGAHIGVPIIVRHPSGIVIGGGVEIGSHCVILHGVTLGEKYVMNSDSKYPVIRDGVQIGCNASILGGLTIGENSVIGAHSLVLNDVAADQTIYGIH
jgi:serine O-acetyltransferase